MTKYRVKPCNSCGKQLLWNMVPWPIETEPRHPELCQSRAYVFQATPGGAHIAVDIRDLPEPPDEAYPQHICRIWREQQHQANQETDRAEAVLKRTLRA